jgi:hypothetical protein
MQDAAFAVTGGPRSAGTRNPPDQNGEEDLVAGGVACLPNLQRTAGTRRVQQRGKARVRAGTTTLFHSADLQGKRGRACPPVPARPTLDLHGKEGVNGSSPSEGSAKAPHVGAFAFDPTCRVAQRAVGMEPFMEGIQNGVAR